MSAALGSLSCGARGTPRCGFWLGSKNVGMGAWEKRGAIMLLPRDVFFIERVTVKDLG